MSEPNKKLAAIKETIAAALHQKKAELEQLLGITILSLDYDPAKDRFSVGIAGELDVVLDADASLIETGPQKVS